MSNDHVFAARMARGWQVITLQPICWKARVILALLGVGAILDWIR